MRIVAGLYGGRRLSVPKNRDIRPTSDKIRGAILNMLASRDAVVGAAVLDAFCGSGALGLEALSRGAASCTFMDKARDSLELARMNAQDLAAGGVFILKDATKIGTRTQAQEPFSLVFLDPPYKMGLVGAALSALLDGGWLADGAWIVCESENRIESDFLHELPTCFTAEQPKTYGDTRIVMLRYAEIVPL